MKAAIQEMRRKLFHLLGLLYLVLYGVAGRLPLLWVVGVAFLMLAVFEAVRLRSPGLNAWLLKSFGGIHRPFEARTPSGILWTLGGVWLTVAVVPHPDIVATSLLYLTLGDGMAGLVGRTFGKVRLGRKSLEGSLACFLTCWVAGTLALQTTSVRPEALLGAAAATTLEMLDIPPNDNLWLPFLSALFLWGVRG